MAAHPYQAEIHAPLVFATGAGFCTTTSNFNGSLITRVRALSTNAFWCATRAWTLLKRN